MEEEEKPEDEGDGDQYVDERDDEDVGADADLHPERDKEPGEHQRYLHALPAAEEAMPHRDREAERVEEKSQGMPAVEDVHDARRNGDEAEEDIPLRAEDKHVEKGDDHQVRHELVLRRDDASLRLLYREEAIQLEQDHGDRKGESDNPEDPRLHLNR